MHKGKLLPPVHLLAAMLLAYGLHHFLPIATIIPAPWNRVGLVLLLLGLILIVAPAAVFKARDTAIRPFDESAVLIQEGLYAYSRNPIYVGMVVLVLGIAILFGTASPLIAPLLLAFILRLVFIRVEEAMLETRFGQEYRTYKSRVRRWL